MTCVAKFLPHKFVPRDYQMPLFNAMLNENKKAAYVVWHRRAGKDRSCWNLLLCKAMQRVGNYFYIFPEIGQGRKAIWLGIDKDGISFLDQIPKHLIKHSGGRPKINNTEMRIELINGSTIQVVGANRYDKLVGTSAVGMVFSEYALQPPLALKYLKPIVNENDGWILINSTPRGHNHAYRLFEAAKDDKDWFVDYITVTDSKDSEGKPIVSDAQIEADKIIMSVEELRQEYFCDWDVALASAYFSRYLRIAETQNRILDFPVDASLPIHTFWDLGISDAMTIWFVQFTANGEIRCVHYYENTNEGFEHYANYINDYRNKNGFVMGEHYAPHDIQVRELSSGATRLERARAIGLNFRCVPRPSVKQDAIEFARGIFSKFYFHKTECQYGIDCLMEYHARIDKNGLTGGPEHNWASHGADAFMLISQAFHQQMLPTHFNPHHNGSIHVNEWTKQAVI